MSELKSKHNIIEYVIDLLSGTDNDGKPVSETEYAARLETAYSIQNFLNEFPGGFLIYRAEGNEEIIYANTALIRIFGCDSFREFKELTHNSFKGIVHPDELDDVEKSIAQQIDGNTDNFDYVEYRIIRKDGSVRWVEDYGHYITSQNMGNLYYVFISDITEKRERELAEKAAITKEHLRRLEIIEALSINYDTILYVDFDAKIVVPYRQSDRVMPLFDGDKKPGALEAYFEKYVETVVCPEDKDRIAKITDPKYIQKMLAKNKTYYENYIGGINGERHHLQLRFVNVGSGKRISQAVVGYRTIDEEVTRETTRMQALENALHIAKQAESAKNTFLSNMSHDLRTPLNALFGYTTLARSKTTDPELIGYLDKIGSASKQMFEQIDKLLEISYIESNEIKIKERACSIREIVDLAYDFALPNAIKKNIACTVDCTDVKHTAVYADGDKIKQVLDYILGNAIKYTPAGGKVILTATEVGPVINGLATFKLSVKDNGIGIKKETLPRIFDPFERENNTTVSGVFGIGLGLTISKTVVELMGGTIDVESKEHKGSTFTVTLSLRVRDDTHQPENDVDSVIESLKGKRVLAVEDNAINLEILTEILADYGFLIDSAENGQIALDKVIAASADYYEFILMDIMMPVLDGRKATMAIRKLPEKRKADIPIIAISANAFESDKRESIEAGMDAHVNKPLDVAALMQTIATVIRSKRK